MRIWMASLFAVVASCTIISAQPAMDVVKVHFSTAVMINGAAIPAGDAIIEPLDTGSDNVVLQIRSEAGPRVVVLVNRLEAGAGNHDPKVILSRRGEQYSLEQVWLPNNTGYRVLRPANE
jgi:hypothetical protein